MPKYMWGLRSLLQGPQDILFEWFLDTLTIEKQTSLIYSFWHLPHESMLLLQIIFTYMLCYCLQSGRYWQCSHQSTWNLSHKLVYIDSRNILNLFSKVVEIWSMPYLVIQRERESSLYTFTLNKSKLNQRTSTFL